MVQATGCFVQPSFSSFSIFLAKAQLLSAGAAAIEAATAPPFINVLLETERSIIWLLIVKVLLGMGYYYRVGSPKILGLLPFEINWIFSLQHLSNKEIPYKLIKFKQTSYYF